MASMEREVRVPGARLRVDDLGVGPPVVLLHGFPLNRSLWRAQVAGLQGVRRIAPDLRGMGESSVPAADYSMATYAADVLAMLDALGLESATFCGLSMGGYVVMEILRRAPERVTAAALLNTRPDADTDELRHARDRQVAAAERDGVGAVVAELLPKLLGEATRAERPDVVRVVERMMTETPLPGFVGAIRAMRDRPDSRAVLRSLRIPALVLVGSDDTVTPPDTAQALADLTPNARCLIVRGSGHLTPVEQPGQVTNFLSAFLQQVLKPA